MAVLQVVVRRRWACTVCRWTTEGGYIPDDARGAQMAHDEWRGHMTSVHRVVGGMSFAVARREIVRELFILGPLVYPGAHEREDLGVSVRFG